MTDIIGGIIGSDAAGTAADQLSAGYKQGATDVTNTQNANLTRIQQVLQPYLDTGTGALASLNAGEAPGGQFSSKFSLNDLVQDPGYQFDLQQGNQAVQRSAAAAGTLNSGGTLKAISQYTTGLASNEINNAYQRYNTDQTNQFNRLYNLAGLGSGAVNQYDAAATNTANTVSNAQYGSDIGSASAQAAGTVGSANAWNGALQGISGNFSSFAQPNAQGQSMLNGGFGSLTTIGSLLAL